MPSNLWVTPEELDESLKESEYAYEACQTASYLLWGMSGRKYSGTRTVTETYRNSNNYNATTLPGPMPYYIDSPQNLAHMLVTSPLSVPDTKIRLRGQPVHKILSVTNANGDVYSEGEYTLFDHRYLDLGRVDGYEVTITYTYGTLPPVAGRMAARKLANEFAWLWSGDERCALPDRVTSVSRENVSYTVLDNQDFIAELRTGIYEVDLFLKTVNPDKARRRSKVITPETRRGSVGRPVSPSTGSTGWVIVPGEGA